MIKYYFHQTTAKKVRAVVIVPGPGGSVSGMKYGHVDNSPAGVPTFCAAMKRRFPLATHINFYDPNKADRQNFIEKIYLE